MGHTAEPLCDSLAEPRVPSARVLATMVMGRVQNGYALPAIKTAVARWAEDGGVDGIQKHAVVKRALTFARKNAAQG